MAKNRRRKPPKPEAATKPAAVPKPRTAEPAAPKPAAQPPEQRRQAQSAAALLDHLRSTDTGKSKIEAGAAWLKEHEGASAHELIADMTDGTWPSGTCDKAEAFIGGKVEPVRS